MRSIDPDRRGIRIIIPRTRAIRHDRVVTPKPIPKVVLARPNKPSIEPPRRSKHVKTIYNTTPSQSADLSKISGIKSIGAGKPLVIIGNGPSVSELDWKTLPLSVDVMSINTPVMDIWPTKYWLFCDISQLKKHSALVDDYKNTIITTTSIKKPISNAIRLRHTGSGFGQNLLEGFNIGRSSVYASMQVALWMDYDPIYIFGCDMTFVEREGVVQTHFFGNNVDVHPDVRKRRFDAEVKSYVEASRILPEHVRKRFVFCSLYNDRPFTSSFRRMDHHQAFEYIRSTYSSTDDP